MEDVVNMITTKVVLCWSVTIILTCSIASYVVYLQNERMAKSYEVKYKKTIDSLKTELKSFQLVKQ